MIKKMFILLFILLGFGAIALSISRSLLDYNEQGRYFDGEVVYNEEAIIVYGLFGILLLIPAVILMRWKNEKK